MSAILAEQLDSHTLGTRCSHALHYPETFQHAGYTDITQEFYVRLLTDLYLY